MKIKKAIITAAGYGTRFLPITKTIPKEMLPVVDRPIIHWIVSECAQAGIEEVIIVADPNKVEVYEDYFHSRAEDVRKFTVENRRFDRVEKLNEVFNLPKITVIPVNRKFPYGNGQPILSAKKYLEKEEAFVVCWGDDLFKSKTSAIKQIVNEFYTFPCDGLLGVVPASLELLSKGAALKIKEGTENQVECLKEKASIEELKNDPSYTNLYSIGRFVLTPKIFDYLTPDATGKDNELWLADANDKLARNGTVRFHKLTGDFYTTGDPTSYLKAQIAFSSTDESIK